MQITPGIPTFTIVGLADKTITESRDRVRGALVSIGLALPVKKILINLAPASLTKEGSHFDLAIACAVLTHIGIISNNEIKKYLILGELGLNGDITGVSGVLPAAVKANSISLGLICPQINGTEAAWSGNDNILAPNNLLSLINHLNGKSTINAPVASTNSKISTNYPDLRDVRGHKIAKRAIEISAAGGHNLLMFGPPGSGKSMLAQCLPSILPQMNKEEILESSMIYSVAGLIKNNDLISIRPFRAPHQSSSLAAIVGGGMGRKIKPGEISLAHNGVLFLDELPEFSRSTIDSLRQPLETQEVLISRSHSHISYPANFQLIAAMNPCPCGYLGEIERQCPKAPICGQNYRLKISGPILDRFHMHIEVSNQSAYDTESSIETSEKIAIRVKKARCIQQQRYKDQKFITNAHTKGQALLKHTVLDTAGKTLLDSAINKFHLSMRSYSTLLKVARTIADLEMSEKVLSIHIAEAINYRCTKLYK